MTIERTLEDAVATIRRRFDAIPELAIVLGSGLGGLADRIEDPRVIHFSEIPGFGTSSASGHRGELILGKLESTVVVAMAGRLHRYEGWTHAQVVFPVRVMSRLGAKRLIVSNAAGGVSPKLHVGDIVVIRDHINWMTKCFDSNEDWPLKASRPDHRQRGILTRAAEVYDAALSRAALNAARRNQFNAYEGTYLATLGPNYETRSEYRMMRRLGADVVGMSTVPEALEASREKMRVLGLSMVSNVASPDLAIQANHAEVLKAGLDAEAKMESIVRAVARC